MPACYLHDRRRDVLVLQDLRPAAPASAPGVAWAHQLGRVLGLVHEATADLTKLPADSRPVPHEGGGPIPDLSALSAQVYAQLSPAEMEAVRRLQSSEPTLVGLRALRQAWTVECLVHGDVRTSNVLLGGGRLWLIDWDQASAGDPALDLAGAVAELLAVGARAASPPIAALLNAYRSVRSTGPLTTKVIAFAGVWLFHRVTAACRRRVTLSVRDQTRLELAATAIAQPGRLAVELGVSDV